VVENPWDSQLS